jgi:hypothetical protein
VPVIVATSLLVGQPPVGAIGAKSVALSIAEYAVATATHDRPAHVVTASDVTNAVSLSTVNTKDLTLLMNIDEVYGYARIALLFDEKSFADICIDFPNTIGGKPRVISCPHEAQGLLNSRAGVMQASDDAVAAAAQRGEAVSGADVVTAAARFHLTLHPIPTFGAGTGGRVKFGTLVEMPPNLKFTVHICVRFPSTAYGIPTQVAC